MESRQETQRPLLTQGEIMQLSADEEIIMVSGAPPVRAWKLRYFKDRNFTERVLPEASIEVPSAMRQQCSPEAKFQTSGRSFRSGKSSSELERDPDWTSKQDQGIAFEPEIAAEPIEKPGVDPLDKVKAAKALDLSAPDTLPSF